MKIVFVHGSGADHTVWRFQTRWLRGRGHKVTAVDLPGHGSDANEPLTSIEDMAEWLIETTAPAVLIGHSMGSLVALQAARLDSRSAQALVLVGTGAAMSVHPELLAAAKSNMPRAARLIAGWSLPASFGGAHSEPGTWQHGAAVRLLERSRPGVLGADLTACENYEAKVDGVDPPVLVINGAADRMTPARGAAALAKSMTGAGYVELAGCGHEPMLQEPKRFNDVLVDFLAGVGE